jgi:hypothetical protein
MSGWHKTNCVQRSEMSVNAWELMNIWFLSNAEKEGEANEISYLKSIRYRDTFHTFTLCIKVLLVSLLIIVTITFSSMQ